jgi:hypothetical protein
VEESDPPVEDSDPPPRDTEAPLPDPPSCVGVTLSFGDWRGSTPFAEAADPTDGAGAPWYAAAFDASAWSAVSLPDVGSIPVGFDRVYRGTLTVSGAPPGVGLELQSDDGIEVWVNGQRVGRWGGAWQQEGCVNDDASCIVFERVAPVAIGALLQPGPNLVAFRVSNPVQNSYADLRVYCITP